jgi:transcriptional regulator with XRE-family HTH domain
MSPATLIRQARRRAGITQAELASRLGKTQPTVAALERPGANPTVATLVEAMHATGHRLELAAVPATAGADDTLIARNLRLSPAERLAAFETAHSEVEELRRAMRTGSGRSGSGSGRSGSGRSSSGRDG